MKKIQNGLFHPYSSQKFSEKIPFFIFQEKSNNDVITDVKNSLKQNSEHKNEQTTEERYKQLEDLRNNLHEKFKDKVSDPKKLMDRINELIINSVTGKGKEAPRQIDFQFTGALIEGQKAGLGSNEFGIYKQTLETAITSIILDENIDQHDHLQIANIRQKFESTGEGLQDHATLAGTAKIKIDKKAESNSMVQEIREIRNKIYQEQLSPALKNNPEARTKLWNKVSELLNNAILNIESPNSEFVHSGEKFEFDLDKGLDRGEFEAYKKYLEGSIRAILLRTDIENNPQLKTLSEQERKQAQQILTFCPEAKALIETGQVPLEQIKARATIFNKLKEVSGHLGDMTTSQETIDHTTNLVKRIQSDIMKNGFNPNLEINTKFEQWDGAQDAEYSWTFQKISQSEFLARITNDTSLITEAFPGKMVKASPVLRKFKEISPESEEAKQVDRLKTLIKNFEQWEGKGNDPEVQKALLNASQYLNSGKVEAIESAKDQLKTIMSYDKNYIDVDKISTSDQDLAFALRKMEKYRESGSIMLKEAFGQKQDAINQAIDEGKSDEEIQKELSKPSKYTENLNEEGKKQVTNILNEAGKLEESGAIKQKAAEKYDQIMRALSAQPLNADFLDKLSANKADIVDAIGTDLALRQSIATSVREFGDKNLGDTLKAYSDMEGLGNFDLSDANEKLAGEIAIALATTVAITVVTAGLGTAASGAGFVGRLAARGPRFARLARGLKRAAQVVQKGIHVLEHPLGSVAKFSEKFGKHGASIAQKINHLAHHYKYIHEAEHVLGHTLTFTAFQTGVRTAMSGNLSLKYIAKDFTGNLKFYATMGSAGALLKSFKNLESIGKLLGNTKTLTGAKVETKIDSYGKHLLNTGKQVTESVIKSNEEKNKEQDPKKAYEAEFEEFEENLYVFANELEGKLSQTDPLPKASPDDKIAMLINQIIQQDPTSFKKDFPNVYKYIS